MSGKKDLGEMIKLGLILVVYAVASCTVLAIVNNFTKPKIKKLTKTEKWELCKTAPKSLEEF